MTHLTEEDLILDFYDESTVEVRGHLSDCTDCRTRSGEVHRFLGKLPIEEVPEPSAGWEQQVWRHLEWRLGRESKRSWRPWILAAAGIVLAFAAGILTRDLVTVPDQPDAAELAASLTSDAEGRNRVFLLVLSDHFERSERVLLELTRDGRLPSDRQSKTDDLLSRNRLYRLTAEQRGNARMASLLEELEPILVEIARSSSGNGEESIEAIRGRIEDAGLIFKIRLLGREVREGVSPAAKQDLSI